MSSNHSHHSSVWQVVVCKECRYAVWPSQVVGHLTNKQHKLARKQAEAEWEEIQGWAGVAQYPSEFAVPPFVNCPIDELASYDDGIKCGLDDGECPYVCRGMNTMKAHWRKIHGFSAGQNRGGSGMLKREDIERRISEHCRRVRCQRFFVQKEHSQYFEVRSGEEQREGSYLQLID
jgi:hypothetical protein